jgi:hypothetical protein
MDLGTIQIARVMPPAGRLIRLPVQTDAPTPARLLEAGVSFPLQRAMVAPYSPQERENPAGEPHMQAGIPVPGANTSRPCHRCIPEDNATHPYER